MRQEKKKKTNGRCSKANLVTYTPMQLPYDHLFAIQFEIHIV